MDYNLLSVEQRIALLKERLLQYEATHFQQVCELEIATKQGLDQVAETARNAIAGFETGIAWVKDEIAKLENGS